MKAIYFMSGLPRSGSTVLLNILAQNPLYGISSPSALLEAMFTLRNVWWDEWVEHMAMPEDECRERLRNTLKAVIYGYHGHIGKSVILDKSRGWLAHIEMLEWALGREAKIIVPVRDVRDILASFERLWRESSQWRQLQTDRENYPRMQTVAGRCEIWTREDKPLGLAYNRIRDALHRGYSGRMHFVEFDTLCRQPERTMRDLYGFLGEKYFTHDFDHIEQVTQEDDRVHGMDLHTIRTKLEPLPPQWPKYLGREVAERYNGLELWND